MTVIMTKENDPDSATYPKNNYFKQEPITKPDISPRTILRKIVIPKAELQLYQYVANTLTSSSLGDYNIAPADSQETELGPLRNPKLLVINVKGQEDWRIFWSVLYHAMPLRHSETISDELVEDVSKSIEQEIKRREWLRSLGITS
jgi:hypothetical protein